MTHEKHRLLEFFSKLFLYPHGFVSLLLIESAIACEAPTKVCDWKKKIVALKTNNMIASGILIDKGLIITNRHVVEDFQSVLVRDHVGNIERASIIPTMFK